MTSFEKFLLEKGFEKYILNCKTMKFEKTNKHIISTMVNLDYRYIHKTDKVCLDKINEGKSVMDDDFTWNDRKLVICFGLREANKPTTLINPRPRIKVKLNKEFKGQNIVVIEDETFDNSMNIVLNKVSYEDIYKAMFDKSILFEYDFT